MQNLGGKQSALWEIRNWRIVNDNYIQLDYHSIYHTLFDLIQLWLGSYRRNFKLTRQGYHRVNDHCWFGGWFLTKNTVKYLPFLSLVSKNFVAVANIAIFFALGC